MNSKKSLEFQLTKEEKENILKEHNQFISEQTKREISIIGRAFADFVLGITKTDTEKRIKERLEQALEKPRPEGTGVGPMEVPDIPGTIWPVFETSFTKEPPYAEGSAAVREVPLLEEGLYAVYSKANHWTGEIALGVAVGNWGNIISVPGIETWLDILDVNRTHAWIHHIFGVRDVGSSGGYVSVNVPISIPHDALFPKPASGLTGTVGLIGTVDLEAYAIGSKKWYRYSGKRFLDKWGRAENDWGTNPDWHGYFKTDVSPSLVIKVSQSEDFLFYITVSVVALVFGKVTPPINDPLAKAKGLACFDASSLPEDLNNWADDYLLGIRLNSYTQSIKIPKINLHYTNCKPW